LEFRRVLFRSRRRWAFLLGAGLLVVVLVGGRWLALETTERAWAATIPGGGMYLMMRDLARLVRGLFLLAAIGWATGNLLFVYRAIGSVQLPRRLGDLEIVEAVPQRLLLAGTVACGLVYGVLLTLGRAASAASCHADRKSTRLNSSHVSISYAVFCLKKKT